MKVNKAFCKPIDGSFDRIIVGREGKSISSKRLKTKFSPFPNENSPRQLTCHILLLRNGAISVAQCWPLLLADWDSVVAETTSALARRSPWSWAQDHIVHECISHDKNGWGKRLAGIHRMGQPTHLIIKFLLKWIHPVVSIYAPSTGIFTIHSYLERTLHIPFPIPPFHWFPSLVLSKSLTIRPNISYTP